MPPLHEASSLAALLVQRCASTSSLRRSRQLHATIITTIHATLHSPYLNNNILSMYARCGSLFDAHQVFDEMPQKNIISYNALISAYSRCPLNARLAFKLFTDLETECIRPNGSTFTSLLQAASCLEHCLFGCAMHTCGIKYGFLNDICVQTSLLGMYSNCGDMDSAKEVFCCMTEKDAMAWNSIIFGYMKNDKIAKGLNLFGSMTKSEAVATQFTYSMVLNACSRLGYYDIGLLTHAHVILSGTPADLPLQNALLDMYCTCGDIKTAVSIFSRIEKPDLVSWNSMLAGYSGNGEGEKAIGMFVQLWQTSIAKPDEYTFAAVVAAIGAFPALCYGKPLHAQVNKAGLDTSVYVGSTLISMYFNNGESSSAEKIFGSISKKDVVLWTEMIAGHSRLADGESAIKFFIGMSQEGHKIDSFALSSAISACADLAAMKQGEIFHSVAIKTGHDVEMTVCGSIIDMYTKIGDLQAAELILSRVDAPNLKCWNSMLGGYGHHGKAEAAFRVFYEILKQGLKPDLITYISMLAACSHCGLVEKGKFLWTCMKENGLTPGPKHISCMISLLSRAGLLEEAEEMILELPSNDSYLGLWRTLLSSCVSNRNLPVGVRAAERILSRDEEDCAANTLITNVYAAAGRWDAVAKMREKVRGLMLEKDPGLSWIEDMNTTHVFSSGDQSHPEVNSVQAELHRLQGNLTIAL